MHVQKRVPMYVWILLTGIVIPFSAYAGPANPTSFQITQPDGEKIRIRVAGDEFYHSFETEDGYTILRNQANAWVYAQAGADGFLKPSDIQVSSMSSRSKTETAFRGSHSAHLSPSGDAIREINFLRRQFNSQLDEIAGCNEPSIRANWNVLVLLVEFNDLASQVTKQDFLNLFNQPGFDNGIGGPGCLNDYMKEVSYNQFSISADVYGWYKENNSYTYFANSNGSSQSRCRDMVGRLLTTADPEVDFTKYDNNGDGTVEGIIVIHSGRGASQDGNNAYIWNFMWWFDTPVAKDGIKIKTFTVDEELEYNRQSGIGMFAHEYGHTLGLPDLYGTPTVGNWCEMATGGWNNEGRTPPHYCAYLKKRLGWSSPVTVKTNGSYTFNQTETDNNIYQCNAINKTEYFLLENRQKVGFDKYIPGNGLLIYHVDSTKGVPLFNFDGGTNSPAVIEEADGKFNMSSSRGDAGDPFPGTSSNKTFNASGNPNNTQYNGLNSYVTVTNISSSQAAMTADVTVPGGASLQSYATPDTVRPYYGGIDTVIHDGGKTTPDWWSAYAAGARYGYRMTPKTAGEGKLIGILVMNPAESQSYKVGLYRWTANAPGSQVYESNTITSSTNGWKYTDVSSANVSVAGDFVVSVCFGTASTKFGADNGSNSRSYWMAQGSTTWYAWGYILYIRAVVDYQGFIDTVKTVVVGNMGTGTNLTVSNITAGQNWIKSITPTTFTVTPGNSQNVTVTFSRQSLSGGTFYDALSITSNDAPMSVPVKFKVSGAVNISEIGTPLTKSGYERFSLYDVKGRLIQTVPRIPQTPDYLIMTGGGYHGMNGLALGAGLYFYTLSSANTTRMKKILIVR